MFLLRTVRPATYYSAHLYTTVVYERAASYTQRSALCCKTVLLASPILCCHFALRCFALRAERNRAEQSVRICNPILRGQFRLVCTCLSFAFLRARAFRLIFSVSLFAVANNCRSNYMNRNRSYYTAVFIT